MAYRGVTIGNTGRERLDGTLLAGAPVTITLITPGGSDVLDTNTGKTVDKTPITLFMDSTGSWSKVVTAPGDMSDPNSYYQVDENNGGSVTTSPSFVYTGSPIVVHDWVIAPATTGMVKMRIDDERFDGSSANGKPIRIGISKDTFWGTKVLDSTAYFTFTTDVNGRVTFYVPPSSALADPAAYYYFRTSSGSIWYFTCPDSTSDSLGEEATLHIVSFVIVGSTAVPGPAGPAGPAGATGATGPTGPTAPTMVASGSGHTGGSVPDPGAVAGTTKYLREDATWDVPPGGGGGGFITDPTSAEGDMLVREGGAIVAMPIGRTDQYLGVVNGDPTYRTLMARGGPVELRKATGDIVYRSAAAPTTIVVGFIGDSITADDPGGGTPAARTVALLATLLGITVTASNQAISGTSSSDWVSGGTDLPAAVTAMTTAGVKLVHVMLGTNDGRGAVSPATYQANMQDMCAYLNAHGFTVVLSYSPYAVVSSGGVPETLTQTDAIYALEPAVDALLDGTGVRQGDTQAWEWFKAHQSELPDNIHPNSTGAQDLAALWATALAPSVFAQARSLDAVVTGGSDGQVLTRVSGVPAWAAGGGGGGGGGITTLYAYTDSVVTGPASAFVDVASLDLTPGTWLLLYSGYFVATLAGTTLGIFMYDGSTIIGSVGLEASNSSNGSWRSDGMFMARYVVTEDVTIHIKAQEDNTTGGHLYNSTFVAMNLSGGDGGATPTLSSQQQFLSADVNLTTANQFYDGPSISLVAGTWLISAQANLYHGTAATTFAAKLYDGSSTIYAGAVEIAQAAGDERSLPIAPVIAVLTGTTTVTLACSSSAGLGLLVHDQGGVPALGAKVTWISAVRIG